MRRFYKIGCEDIATEKSKILGYLAYGCPFVDQNYDIVDNNRVDTIIRSMACEPAGKPSDTALGACRTLSPMNFDPNGLSGGPVFAEGSEIVLKYAGMINRAGGGIIHFIKAEAVKRLLDLSLQT